jgi:SAM-dependent methyltransferase/organic radical activating enzyme
MAMNMTDKIIPVENSLERIIADHQFEGIKRFINCHFPVTACNLRCHYCYITQTGDFDKLPVRFNYSPEHMAGALSVERLGGVSNLNLCAAGETLLYPGITEIVEIFLKTRHFVSIVTNGTVTKIIKEISDLPPELTERLFFKFSFHYLELKRTNKLDLFFSNVKICRRKGIAFTLELTANDESIPHIPDIMKICKAELGADCHVMETRDVTQSHIPRLTGLSVEEHIKTWSVFNSPLFSFQQDIWGKNQNHSFCYAGDWTTHLELETGNLFQCFRGKLIQNIFEDAEEPIRFLPIASLCPFSHCYCAYTWLVLGSAIPAINTPYYADFRNRIADDGSEWLSPKVKQFFGTKCCENNEPYPEAKQFVINSLMTTEYKRTLPAYAELRALTEIFSDLLKKLNIFECVVYGKNGVVEWLGNIFENLPVSADYYTEDYSVDFFCGMIKEDAMKPIIIADIENFIKIKKSIVTYFGSADTPPASQEKVLLGNNILSIVDLIGGITAQHSTAQHSTAHRFIRHPENIFPKIFKDDGKTFMDKYSLKEYHIDFFNAVSQIYDFSGKTVLEIGGSNMPKQLTHELLGAKKWVCVDKPWAQHFIDWPEHYKNIPIYNINEKKLKQALDENDYLIFNCYAQDIPDDFAEQFDVGISTCSFEHIPLLRTSLKKIHNSLKTGGIFYTTFAPIWSSGGGSHYWINNDLHFNNYRVILPHAHLLKRIDEIYDILKENYPNASETQLEDWADRIKNGVKELNHLFFEDYEKIFYESPFSRYYMEAFCPQETEPNFLMKLKRMYPGYERFDAWGIEFYAIK